MSRFSHQWSRLFDNTRLFGLILMVCVAAWSTAAISQTTSIDLTRPILIVGDSLSSEYGIKRQTGWVELLRHRLAQKYAEPPAVINASISGDTTSGGLTRLPALLKQHAPAIVVIELGGNDALRGLSLDMTKQNLIAMLELSANAGAATVLTGMQIPANYGPAYTEAFRDLYPEVAQATGAVLVPFLLAGLETDRNLFIEDGIHPAEQAQPILLDNVWPALESLLPQAP